MTYEQRLKQVRELIDEYFDISMRLESTSDHYIRKLLYIRQEQIRDNLEAGIN